MEDEATKPVQLPDSDSEEIEKTANPIEEKIEQVKIDNELTIQTLEIPKEAQIAQKDKDGSPSDQDQNDGSNSDTGKNTPNTPSQSNNTPELDNKSPSNYNH